MRRGWRHEERESGTSDVCTGGKLRNFSAKRRSRRESERDVVIERGTLRPVQSALTSLEASLSLWRQPVHQRSSSAMASERPTDRNIDTEVLLITRHTPRTGPDVCTARVMFLSADRVNQLEARARNSELGADLTGQASSPAQLPRHLISYSEFEVP